MRNIKFIMSRGEDQVFTRSMAEQILGSREQLIRVTVNGEWTGYALNKAHIVQTQETDAVVTTIASKQSNLLPVSPKIEDIKPADRVRITKKIKEVKNNLSHVFTPPGGEERRDLQ